MNNEIFELKPGTYKGTIRGKQIVVEGGYVLFREDCIEETSIPCTVQVAQNGDINIITSTFSPDCSVIMEIGEAKNNPLEDDFFDKSYTLENAWIKKHYGLEDGEKEKALSKKETINPDVVIIGQNRTGRSTKILQEAIKLASESKNVFVLANTNPECRNLYKLCSSLCYLPLCNETELRIILRNIEEKDKRYLLGKPIICSNIIKGLLGSITFRTPENIRYNKQTGKSPLLNFDDTILLDHSVDE